MAAKMRREALVYRVAAVTLRRGMDDRAFCDDRDVGRAGADVDDRRGALVGWQNAGAERRREALFHHKDLADAGVFGGIEQGALLDVRHVRDHAHHGLRAKCSSRPSSPF